MPDATQQIEEILDKLTREIEASVHAFYRGDVRQHTQRIKTDTFRLTAVQSLLALTSDADAAPRPATPSTGVPAAGATLSADESETALRCVMAWQPMGPPNAAAADSRCVPGAREMLPSWGEREKARIALTRSES
jgi:hypothetical protein